MKQTLPHQELELPRKILVAVFLAVAVWYFNWRLGTFNSDALTFSYLLYGAEVYGLWTTLMHLFMTWRLTVREPPPASEGWSVDVFIPTLNEPVSILRRTLVNAQAMNYPHQTWLLDDGARPEMESLAKELGCRYLARPGNTDAKAGNLNYALQRSEGEFIAVFDADHAPARNFLVRTLGYFKDASVAFVQTPQDFYNLDSFQHHKQKGKPLAWHEQSVFFRVIQRGKDYWNAAFFCGSCAVIRRSALQAVGGFATGTVTEDLHTSVKLHKKGFTSVYHAESLAFGLAPTGIRPFLNQRIRWGQGAAQIWRKEGVFFCRGLTLAQRINYLASSITYFDGWQKGFLYLAPVIVLSTGIAPLIAGGPEFILHFVPYFLLTFWVFEEVNRGYGRSVIIEQYNMARFAAMAWSTLAFFKTHLTFSVTPKGEAPPSGTGWYTLPQTIVLILNGLAIAAGAVFYFSGHHLSPEAMTVCTIWASVNLLLALSVLLFNRVRSRFRRREYRFPIPLPATMTLSGSEVYGVIDDISATGFRFYGFFPGSIQPGDPLTGGIYLPTGPLSIQAEIMVQIPGQLDHENFVKAIGCRFIWKDKQAENDLLLFLYGSNIQTRMNGLRETIQTPLDRFKGLGSPGGAGDLHPHWSAMSYSQDRDGQLESGLGLVRADKAPESVKSLVVFKPLTENSSIELNVHGRGSISKFPGTIRMNHTMDAAAYSIYCYDLIPSSKDPS